MAFRWFPGKSEEWLLAELSKALDDQAAGRTVVSASAGDVSFTHLSTMQLDTRLARIKHDLAVIDPETYEPADYILQNRSKIAFSG